MKKHKHHITPKHAGGSDDPSNLVELNIEDHAEAHRKLWEKYGCIEDKIAWQMLLGRKMTEDDRILLSKAGFSKFLKDLDRVERWRNSIKFARKKQIITDEHKKNISLGLIQAWANGKMDNRILDSDRCRETYFKNNMGNRLADARRSSETWHKSVTSNEYKNKKRMSDPRRKKIVVDGVEYQSIRQAAKETNYSYNQLRLKSLSESQQE